MVFIIAFIAFALIAVFIVPMFLGGFSSNPDPNDFDTKSEKARAARSQKSEFDLDKAEWVKYYREHGVGEIKAGKNSSYWREAPDNPKDSARHFVAWEQEQESLHEYDDKGPAPKGM